MFDPQIEPVPDEELETILTAALRSGGGQLTRQTECYLATVSARALVDRMALAGLRVVRIERRLT